MCITTFNDIRAINSKKKATVIYSGVFDRFNQFISNAKKYHLSIFLIPIQTNPIQTKLIHYFYKLLLTSAVFNIELR